MKWITRERPKIDRLACPWLIKKFVDKDAEFIYVPFSEVLTRAKELVLYLLIFPMLNILITIANALLITLLKNMK